MVFIEELEDGKPYNTDGVLLCEYLKEEGIPYQLIKKDVIQFINHSIPKNHTYVGSIPFMKEIFFYKGKFPTLPFNNLNNGRVMYASDFRELVNGTSKSYFVKPYNYHDLKAFDGFVCDKFSLGLMDGFNSMVIVYEPLTHEILSEWRAYISDGELLDVRNYAGSAITYPNNQFIIEVIERVNKLNVMPNTYCIDIAILEDGTSEVVEFTDMWSVESYGVDMKLYFRMLKNRFYEIITK